MNCAVHDLRNKWQALCCIPLDWKAAVKTARNCVVFFLGGNISWRSWTANCWRRKKPFFLYTRTVKTLSDIIHRVCFAHLFGILYCRLSLFLSIKTWKSIQKKKEQIDVLQWADTPAQTIGTSVVEHQYGLSSDESCWGPPKGGLTNSNEQWYHTLAASGYCSSCRDSGVSYA